MIVDKLQEIKERVLKGYVINNDVDWLIEEIERLRTIEQVYEATMKAYRG